MVPHRGRHGDPRPAQKRREGAGCGARRLPTQTLVIRGRYGAIPAKRARSTPAVRGPSWWAVPFISMIPWPGIRYPWRSNIAGRVVSRTNGASLGEKLPAPPSACSMATPTARSVIVTHCDGPHSLTEVMTPLAAA